MASEQRIKDLQLYCKQSKENLEASEAHRDELISWQKKGMFVFENDNNEDQFPSLIEAADNAVKMYKKVLIFIESIRDRAINGEDV